MCALLTTFVLHGRALVMAIFLIFNVLMVYVCAGLSDCSKCLVVTVYSLESADPADKAVRGWRCTWPITRFSRSEDQGRTDGVTTDFIASEQIYRGRLFDSICRRSRYQLRWPISVPRTVFDAIFDLFLWSLTAKPFCSLHQKVLKLSLTSFSPCSS